jgi:hypothetical protein
MEAFLAYEIKNKFTESEAKRVIKDFGIPKVGL